MKSIIRTEGITRTRSSPRDIGDQSCEKTTFPDSRVPGNQRQFPPQNHPLDDPFQRLIDDLGQREQSHRGFVCGQRTQRPLPFVEPPLLVYPLMFVESPRLFDAGPLVLRPP